MKRSVTDNRKIKQAVHMVNLMARMTEYNFDTDDDTLEDCVSTLNRLIQEARKIAVQS